MSSSNRVPLCYTLLLGVFLMITLIMMITLIFVTLVALVLILTLFIFKLCLGKCFPAFAGHVAPLTQLAARKLTMLTMQALGDEIAADSNAHTTVPEFCSTTKANMAESNFLKAVLPSYSTCSSGTKLKEITLATTVATATDGSSPNSDEISEDEMTSDGSIISSDTEDLQDNAAPTSHEGDLLFEDKLFKQGEDALANSDVCGTDHIVVKDTDSSAAESECFESASENAGSVSDDAGSLPSTIYESLSSNVADSSPEGSSEQSDTGQEIEFLVEQDVSASDLVIMQTKRDFFPCPPDEEEMSSDAGQLVIGILGDPTSTSQSHGRDSGGATADFVQEALLLEVEQALPDPWLTPPSEETNPGATGILVYTRAGVVTANGRHFPLAEVKDLQTNVTQEE